MKQRYFALVLLLAAGCLRAGRNNKQNSSLEYHLNKYQNVYGALLCATAGYLTNTHGQETLGKGLIGASLGFGYNSLTGIRNSIAAPVIAGLAIAGLHQTETFNKASKLLPHKS